MKIPLVGNKIHIMLWLFGLIVITFLLILYYQLLSPLFIAGVVLIYLIIFLVTFFYKFQQIVKQRDELLENKFVLENELYVLKGMEDMVNKYTQKLEKTTQKLEDSNRKLHKSQAELKDLNATKDKFFSIVAHDLRNPFGNVMNMSDLILSMNNFPGNEDVKTYIELIHSSAKQGFTLLENLLEWSRSQTGRIKHNPQYIKLKDFFEINRKLVQNSALAKNIKLVIHDSNDIVVYADSDMINTVLRNLISNAIKFTPVGGQISLSGQNKDDKFIEICIEDSGVGIEKDDVGKIFDVGESFTTPGTNQEKGSGLGLILCKEFINKNGGEIWVESAPGEGSQFYFTLPKFSET